jgi:hypothetical protein
MTGAQDSNLMAIAAPDPVTLPVPGNAAASLVAALAPLTAWGGQKNTILLAWEGCQAFSTVLIAPAMTVALVQPSSIASPAKVPVELCTAVLHNCRVAGRGAILLHVITLFLGADSAAGEAEAILLIVVKQTAEVSREGESDESVWETALGEAS